MLTTGSRRHADHVTNAPQFTRATLIKLRNSREQQPYKSADRVYWILDNGSSHRGQAAIDRLARQYPNAIMVHTPVHASWLNQIEIYFSILQRKALSPNDFTDLGEVTARLAQFETRYNQTARPFKWKFTTTDLAELLARLDNHQPAQPRAA